MRDIHLSLRGLQGHCNTCSNKPASAWRETALKVSRRSRRTSHSASSKANPKKQYAPSKGFWKYRSANENACGARVRSIWCLHASSNTKFVIRANTFLHSLIMSTSQSFGNVLAPGSFGMTVQVRILIWSVEVPKHNSLHASWNTSVNERANFFKRKAGTPSGPGDLPLSADRMMFSTSTSPTVMRHALKSIS